MDGKKKALLEKYGLNKSYLDNGRPEIVVPRDSEEEFKKALSYLIVHNCGCNKRDYFQCGCGAFYCCASIGICEYCAAKNKPHNLLEKSCPLCDRICVKKAKNGVDIANHCVDCGMLKCSTCHTQFKCSKLMLISNSEYKQRRCNIPMPLTRYGIYINTGYMRILHKLSIDTVVAANGYVYEIDNGKIYNAGKFNVAANTTTIIPGGFMRDKCFNKKEKEVHLILLKFFNVDEITPFYYPNWLFSPITGRGLELDFWIEKIGLAVEYNGPFHYLPIYGEQHLLNQQARDGAKVRGLAQKGHELMVIPDAHGNVDLEQFITQFLREFIARKPDLLVKITKNRGILAF
ncbi:hypothetical protein D6_00509 [Faustovirus]|nr:hypothetical protein D6_00509 [Faustovirus]AMP43962.1 hypothetical protein PRJ_Dakar_00001 [Faustovirus]